MKKARAVQKMQNKSGQKMLEEKQRRQFWCIDRWFLDSAGDLKCHSPEPDKLPKFFTVCSKN